VADRPAIGVNEEVEQERSQYVLSEGLRSSADPATSIGDCIDRSDVRRR